MEDNCTHQKTVILSVRASYSDTFIQVSDGSFTFDGDESEPEEVTFPDDVTDFNIENDSSGSYVTVDIQVCTQCRRLV